MISQETLEMPDRLLSQMARLEHARADPAFVLDLWALVTQPPELIRLQARRVAGIDLELQAAEREVADIGRAWQRYSALAHNPEFADDGFLVHHAHQTLLALAGRFGTVLETFFALYQKLTAVHPLLGCLEDIHRAPRGRGRPADPRITLWLVLLTAHLKQRTGRPCYQLVGEVTQALFSKPLKMTGPERNLGKAVKSRVMTFLREARHKPDDVPLYPAVLARHVGWESDREG